MSNLDSMMPELRRQEYADRVHNCEEAERQQMAPSARLRRQDHLRYWLADRLIALGLRLKRTPYRQGYA